MNISPNRFRQNKFASAVLLSAVLLFVAPGKAGEPVTVDALPSTAGGAWKVRASVQWSGTPLRESLARLAESYSFRFLLDRRIDPSTKLFFEAKNESMESLLPRLAAEHGFGCHLLPSTVYIGPEASATLLPDLLRHHRKQAAKLPSKPRRFLRENFSVVSPFLGEPKDILDVVLRRGGLTWSNPDALPYDLWNETELAGSADEILTLLLLGFDKTFEVGGESLVVVPIPEIEPVSGGREKPDGVSATKQPLSDKNVSREKIPLSRRRFTIKAEEQQLDVLLRSLADRLELELDLDEASLARKGVAVDRRVSFEVKNATAAELFRAVLKPLNLEFRLRADTLRVY